jgi:lipid-binding SYLF domain-containing protein
MLEMLREAMVTLARTLLIGLLGFMPANALAGWDPDKPAAIEIDPKSEAGKSAQFVKLDQACRDTLTAFTEFDPGLKRYIEKAYAYAVFPRITKGGVGLGGASGKGLFYDQGKIVGQTHASQFTIGAQLGGMSLRQVIFFKDRSSADEFKAGTVRFGAAAAAVAASAGGASTTDYSDGVAIFILARNGAMLVASIGGMKYSFKPLSPGR